MRGDGVAVLSGVGDFGGVAQCDGRDRLHGDAKGVVQVGAVKGPVGSAVAGFDVSAEGELRERMAGEAVHDTDVLWVGDFAGEMRCDAEGLQDAAAVGANLDAGAVFGGDSALFEDRDGAACASQSQGCGKACDASACDEDVSGVWGAAGHASRLSSLGGDRRVGNAALGVGFVFAQARIVHIKRRTVGAKDLAVCAHVEEDVRVVERRAGAHALEFLDADEDFFCALVVGKVGVEMCGHGGLSGRFGLRMVSAGP